MTLALSILVAIPLTALAVLAVGLCLVVAVEVVAMFWRRR